MRKKEVKRVSHKIVRKIDGKREIRFIPLNIPENTKLEKIFTKKHGLPKFKFVDKSNQRVVIDQLKSIGWLGSDALIRLFPEYEKATIGQLIRYHFNENTAI